MSEKNRYIEKFSVNNEKNELLNKYSISDLLKSIGIENETLSLKNLYNEINSYKEIHNNLMSNLLGDDISKKILNNLNTIISSEYFQDVIKNINFNEMNINADGSIEYEDEKIFLNKETAESLVREINCNDKDKKNFSDNRKSLIIISFIFIIQSILAGFFNETGKDGYLMLKDYIKDGKFENAIIQEPNSELSKNCMHVNADKLNVRESPD